MAEEHCITLSDVEKLLEEEGKKRELSNDQRLALDHAQKLSKLDLDKARELKEELLKLDFINEQLACKLVDLLPSHSDDIRVLFSKERLVLDKKYIEQILKVVEKYQ